MGNIFHMILVTPACTSGQLLPDPEDCFSYITCGGGASGTCPTSLVLNPAIHACDYAYNVPCAGKESN